MCHNQLLLQWHIWQAISTLTYVFIKSNFIFCVSQSLLNVSGVKKSFTSQNWDSFDHTCLNLSKGRRRLDKLDQNENIESQFLCSYVSEHWLLKMNVAINKLQDVNRKLKWKGPYWQYYTFFFFLVTYIQLMKE